MAALSDDEKGPAAEPTSMPTLPIIFVDGDIKIVCEAPQAALIRELEALDSKIYDLTEREDKLGEIANSGTPDNCARRAWEQAGEELAQARQSQSAITSCLEDKTWGQAAEWLAQAHLAGQERFREKIRSALRGTQLSAKGGVGSPPGVVPHRNRRRRGGDNCPPPVLALGFTPARAGGFFSEAAPRRNWTLSTPQISHGRARRQRRLRL